MAIVDMTVFFVSLFVIIVWCSIWYFAPDFSTSIYFQLYLQRFNTKNVLFSLVALVLFVANITVFGTAQMGCHSSSYVLVCGLLAGLALLGSLGYVVRPGAPSQNDKDNTHNKDKRQEQENEQGNKAKERSSILLALTTCPNLDDPIVRFALGFVSGLVVSLFVWSILALSWLGDWTCSHYAAMTIINAIVVFMLVGSFGFVVIRYRTNIFHSKPQQSAASSAELFETQKLI